MNTEGKGARLREQRGRELVWRKSMGKPKKGGKIFKRKKERHVTRELKGG